MRTSIAALAPIIILLLLAAAGAVIYFLIYRKRVNRALNEGSDVDSAGPEPASVSRSGLMIVLIIAMGIMLIRIANLNSNIKRLNDMVANQSYQLMNIQNELEELQQNMKEEASLISDFNMIFNQMDPADHTAELTFQVTPKKTTEDMTIVVAADDMRIPLQRSSQGTTFTGSCTLDIFTSFLEPVKVLMTQNGETMTVETDNYELTELWQHYLPQIIVSGGGSGTYKKDAMEVEWTIGLDLIAKTEYGRFEKNGITLTTMLDGQVTETKDISNEVSWEEDYGVMRMDVKKNFPIREDQTLSMVVSLKDNMGYTHECTVMELSGVHSHEEVKENEYRIYDASGKLISR